MNGIGRAHGVALDGGNLHQAAEVRKKRKMPSAGIGVLFEKLANKLVLGMDKILERPVEDQAAFLEHEEGGVGIELAFRKRHHATRLGIEAVVAKSKGVLQAMGDEQRRSGVDIALLDDELNDGSRGDGIQPTGRRIVEDELGIVNEGASDGHAPPHTAGKAGRKETEGLFQTDEIERLVNPGIDFFVGHPLLDELVTDVIADRERIEECAFLENDSGARAQREQLLFRHARDVFTKEHDAAGLGTNEPDDELEEDALAYPGGPEQHACLTGRYGKGDAAKNGRAVEGKGDVVQGDDRTFLRRGRRRIGCEGGVAHVEKKKKQHVGDEEVDCDDEDRGVDDRRDGGAALRPRCLRGPHAVEAAGGSENVTKEKGLDQSLDDVRIVKALVRHMEVLGSILMVQNHRDRGAAKMPNASAMMVRSRSMAILAKMRGVTSFRMGSTRARIASICSVTTIEPSSLAIEDALRPATIIPVRTAPSSRIMVRPTNCP